MELYNTLWNLIGNLLTLGRELLVLAATWALLIAWVAWWLFGVNWKKAWPTLREGAWAPLVLLMVMAALVWSRIAPACDCPIVGLLPNFWQQLVEVVLIVGLALFCGWLQIYFQWSPPEISLDPPAHGAEAGHGHAATAHHHDSHTPHAAHH